MEAARYQQTNNDDDNDNNNNWPPPQAASSQPTAAAADDGIGQGDEQLKAAIAARRNSSSSSCSSSLPYQNTKQSLEQRRPLLVSRLGWLGASKAPDRGRQLLIEACSPVFRTTILTAVGFAFLLGAVISLSIFCHHLHSEMKFLRLELAAIKQSSPSSSDAFVEAKQIKPVITTQRKFNINLDDLTDITMDDDDDDDAPDVDDQRSSVVGVAGDGDEFELHNRFMLNKNSNNNKKAASSSRASDDFFTARHRRIRDDFNNKDESIQPSSSSSIVERSSRPFFSAGAPSLTRVGVSGNDNSYKSNAEDALNSNDGIRTSAADAFGNDPSWAYLTPYSRVPMFALQEYCKKMDVYCSATMDKGTKGDRGEPGPPGPAGPRGDKGEQGAASNLTGRPFVAEELREVIPGPPGPPGAAGPPGQVGPKGDKGELGPSGPSGNRGPQGIQGVKGDKGEKGYKGTIVGVFGPKGDRGETGNKGEPGPAGERGRRGKLGPSGEKGEKGDKGAGGLADCLCEKGDRGEKGERGERGERGMVGFLGYKGEKGERGPSVKGDKGDRGDLTETCEKCADGAAVSTVTPRQTVMPLPGGSSSRDAPEQVVSSTGTGLIQESTEPQTTSTTSTSTTTTTTMTTTTTTPTTTTTTATTTTTTATTTTVTAISTITTTTTDPMSIAVTSAGEITTTTAPSTPSPTTPPWPDLPTITYLPPEESTNKCMQKIYQVGIPQRERSLPVVPSTSVAGLQSNFGAYMLDTARPSDDTIWETRGPFGHKVFEYENFAHFTRMSRPIREHNLLQRNSYFGAGHLVYSGELIYNRVNTATIVAFSFVTGEIRVSREFADAFFEPLQPALIPNEQSTVAELVGVSTERWLRGFIKLVADENGLWAMYLHRYNSSLLVVHQLDPFSLDTIFRRHVVLPKDYGTGFIICGTLYTLSDEELSGRKRAARLMQAYDIFNAQDISKMLENITISIPRAPMAMLTYVPHRTPPTLHAWGEELQFKYKLNLQVPKPPVKEHEHDHEHSVRRLISVS